MSASRVVYTAITNGHAQLSAHPDVPDTDFICYSDVPLDRDDWQIRPVEALTQLSPRMRAKFHKVFAPAGYEWSVWVDGAYVLRTDDKAKYLVDDLIRRSPSGFGLHEHYDRCCLFDEAVHSLTLPKCEDQRQIIEEQVHHYAAMGHPRNWGLWAAGFMCRKSSPRVSEIMGCWWDELTRWSWRDQISLSYVLRNANFRPDSWPWPLFPIGSNPYVATWKFNPT
jgi:hypothetical protein